MKHHSSLNGFWSPHTATLDWCEENYAVTHYIAEFYNTLSSLFFPTLAIYSGYQNHKTVRLPRRFWLSLFILGFVGLGSAFFHGTLKYEMQLVDELPMIYGASQQLFCIVPHLVTGIILSTFCLLFTWYYVFINRNPTLHEILFAAIELSFVIIIYFKIKKLDNQKEALELLRGGILINLFGAFLWSLDNNYCSYLRSIRRVLDRVFTGPLLELHAWWHILSSLGVLWLLSCCFVVYYEERGAHVEAIYFAGWVPLLRVKSKTN